MYLQCIISIGRCITSTTLLLRMANTISFQINYYTYLLFIIYLFLLIFHFVFISFSSSSLSTKCTNHCGLASIIDVVYQIKWHKCFCFLSLHSMKIIQNTSNEVKFHSNGCVRIAYSFITAVFPHRHFCWSLFIIKSIYLSRSSRIQKIQIKVNVHHKQVYKCMDESKRIHTNAPIQFALFSRENKRQ